MSREVGSSLGSISEGTAAAEMPAAAADVVVGIVVVFDELEEGRGSTMSWWEVRTPQSCTSSMMIAVVVQR
jgi:hypothetical protein